MLVCIYLFLKLLINLNEITTFGQVFIEVKYHHKQSYMMILKECLKVFVLLINLHSQVCSQASNLRQKLLKYLTVLGEISNFTSC